MAERKEVIYTLERDSAYEKQEMLKAGWEVQSRELGPNSTFKYVYLRYSDAERRAQRRSVRRFWYGLVAAIIVICLAIDYLPAVIAGPLFAIVVIGVSGVSVWWRSANRCRNCGHHASFSKSAYPICARCGRPKRAVA